MGEPVLWRHSNDEKSLERLDEAAGNSATSGVTFASYQVMKSGCDAAQVGSEFASYS